LAQDGLIQHRPGFDAELGIDHRKSETSILAFDNLTTQSFEQSEAYVPAAVKAASVQHYMRKSILGRRKPVYLVTGTRIVSGAKIKYTHSNSFTATARAEVDGTVAAVQVKIGPSAHWTKKANDETEFDRLSEFLFAFRVKVSYKHGEVVGEDHKEGAFLGYDGMRKRPRPLKSRIFRFILLLESLP
jgi:hypothetical protein